MEAFKKEPEELINKHSSGIPSTALLDCDCPLWVENLPKLNGFIVMGNVHGMEYDGEQFLFCPWCGKKRNQSNAGTHGR